MDVLTVWQVLNGSEKLEFRSIDHQNEAKHKIHLELYLRKAGSRQVLSLFIEVVYF